MKNDTLQNTTVDFRGVIYCTTNTVNGRKYIGLDSKNNPNYLGSGNLMHHALKKHGKENFKKQILEFCSSKENLNEAEKYWIDYFGAVKSDLFYNIASGGTGGDLSNSPNWEKRNRTISEKLKITNIGHYVSPEAKVKMSIAKLGKKQTVEHIRSRVNRHYKSVVQLDLQGNFIAEFASLKEAQDKTGAGSIGSVCKNIPSFNTCKGFKWMYKSDYDLLLKKVA